jgi:hypothetical protein
MSISFITPDKSEDKQWALSVNNELHPLTVDQADDTGRLLNCFGDQGWELVQENGGVFLLKRPKNEK